MLTIAYVSSRREPMLDWFLESLWLQMSNKSEAKVLVITPYSDSSAWERTSMWPENVWFFHPKPTVWQGPHRLTKHDYFAASNARNTAICLAPDGWIAFVDDLSVLMPGWLNAVRDAIAGNYIACGAFRKVLKLVVENGDVKSFEDHPAGHDSRWAQGNDMKAVKCPANWLFGCSVAAPVNAFLKINGWPEDCDSTGLGLEDNITGLALANSGHKLKYDRRMFTLESEERHHLEKPMLRMDKNRGKVIEVAPGIKHPDEKGHALVKRLSGKTWFENDFGPFPDLAALRQHVLNGGEFPIVNRPTVDWYDGQPLSEL